MSFVTGLMHVRDEAFSSVMRISGNSNHMLGLA